MNEISTLGTVRDRLSEASRAHHDEMIRTLDMEFESLDVLRILGRPHRLRPVAQSAIATRFRVPSSYLRKCNAHLQRVNLDYWLHRELNSEFFVRFDGDDVRGIFTPRYRPVNHLDIVRTLEEVGYDPRSPVQARLDDDFLSLSLPDSRSTFVIGDRDRVTPGVSISNSETGIAALSVSGYALRLLCTNGLILATSVSASYKHVSEKILGELPRLLSEAAAGAGRARRQAEISLKSPVRDPLATLGSFGRQFCLSPPERAALEWAWPAEAGDTMWNIVNAFTRAAQQPGLPPLSSHRLERCGGTVLSMVQ